MERNIKYCHVRIPDGKSFFTALNEYRIDCFLPDAGGNLYTGSGYLLCGRV